MLINKYVLHFGLGDKFYLLFPLYVFLNICLLNVFLDSQSKMWLEDEYIKRYIGELTPLQESKLVQFKKQLSQLQKSKVQYILLQQ